MDWEDSVDCEEIRKQDILDLNAGTRLSFENPNYFLSEVTARLNDTLNSNTSGASRPVSSSKHRRRKSMSAEDTSSEEDDNDETMGASNLPAAGEESSDEEELEITSLLNQEAAALASLSGRSKPRTDVIPNRTRYAKLNVEEMGVNLRRGPVPERNISLSRDEYTKPMEIDRDETPLDEPANAGGSRRLWEASALSRDEDDLPFGWEQRHSTSQGIYYYHTGTGISQKERPRPVKMRARCRVGFGSGNPGMRRPLSMTSDRVGGEAFRRSMTSSTLSDIVARNSQLDDSKWKRNSLPANCAEKGPLRFVVKSLGSLEIPEEELTHEKSSKAVNRCIVGLSGGTESPVSIIGQGNNLFLDLDESSLKLTDAETGTLLVSQPIHTIRVWGVGRDNGRDFAYVAKNKTTRKYMCHVFCCDGPARVIANSLRDICKRIMFERHHGGSGSNGSVNANASMTSSMSSNYGLCPPPTPGASASVLDSEVTAAPRRPTSLAVGSKNKTDQSAAAKNAQIASILQTFPTPMDEPRKVIKAVYVGSQEVSKSAGMDVLNGAIDYLTASVPIDQWMPVNIAVAPSTITVTTSKEIESVREPVEFECRVRFLSFLGIGKNIIYSGFIVHTAQEKFVAHVFSCEPSSANLCRTIEAACKLRYQKCMDAHGPRKATKEQSTPVESTVGKLSADAAEAGKTFRTALKSMIGSIASATTKRIKSLDSA